ncbi:hypothetical protein [Aureivirga sp. CE67]|uniref:hypothetical protein n=1 Tax=Aureivirga sp. CE67 TaxID=1788983 RepID=UPI001E62559E|nr:hypothetical protein [Aureivirga sp. CE67]
MKIKILYTMEEDKRKHLEFIQNVIARMNSNSFMIKGWVVTLVSALFALIASGKFEKELFYVSYLIIILFWILDGYFLSKERQYRGLYKTVAKKKNDIDFNMNVSEYNKEKNTWISSIFSETFRVFFGLLIIITSIIYSFIN